MIPELDAVAGALQCIRIPPELDVPVTPRVKAILDCRAMRRLSKISQLGLVSLVYPGANHSRFEHSLGVYRLAVQALSLLRGGSDTREFENERGLRLFLVSALVHDIGHWPYCHPLEDLQLDWIPRHEQLAKEVLCEAELASVLTKQWDLQPEEVAEFLTAQGANQTLLHSLLNGPVDIDKMDYLQRDSLHAGVPYGRNFDVARLLSSLCAGPERTRIAITEKGKTAAEMMVFARYVMFSEVYWHHTVRSATAMLQRAVFELYQNHSSFIERGPTEWLSLTDQGFSDELFDATNQLPQLRPLIDGIFGTGRKLYKRLAQFSFAEHPEVHRALARRPYRELVDMATRFSQRLNRYTTQPLAPTDLLIDAPPVKLEVQFKLDVRRKTYDQTVAFDQLGTISPVVKSLATEQFDNFVKRVRVFVSADKIQDLQIPHLKLIEELLSTAN